MVRRLAFPAPPKVWSEGTGKGWEGGGQEPHGGPRGLLGPSLHPSRDPEALQNPMPRPETSCCSMVWQTIAYYNYYNIL